MRTQPNTTALLRCSVSVHARVSCGPAVLLVVLDHVGEVLDRSDPHVAFMPRPVVEVQGASDILVRGVGMFPPGADASARR